MPAEPLGIYLASSGTERVHAAFQLAATAAALGRKVVVFATGSGCRTLLADPSGLPGWEREALLIARGVPGVIALRSAAIDCGVRLLACTAALRAEAIAPAELAAAVETSGIISFLEEVGEGNIVAF